MILKYYIRFFLFFIFFTKSFFSNSQISDGFQEFKYPSGKIASKGFLKNGKPEGYWVNFYENGTIKSEGNRTNYKLDSIWNFYDKDGILSVSINYKSGLKTGNKITYDKEKHVIKNEFFDSDTIQSLDLFYRTGQIKLKILFENGLKHGYAFQYDTTGLEKIWWIYNFGKGDKFLINRKDNLGRKTGRWVLFKNGKIIQDVNYLNGSKYGFERRYSETGDLMNINEYVNGEVINNIKDFSKFDYKKEYNKLGLVNKSGSYTFNGDKHGVHRIYNEKGRVESSFIYNNGILIGEGIVKKDGSKDGLWLSYYDSGKKKSKGFYKNNVKFGDWEYYYENGLIESKGLYSFNGKQDSIWKEYYSHGGLREEITYYEGIYEGLFVAYDDTGKVIVKGLYIDNYEDGYWFYNNGCFSQQGNYLQGQKIGEWKSYFNNKLIFKGSFQNGTPNGEHIFWYKSGNLFRIGDYAYGRKTGEWFEYAESGKVLIITTYSDGLERVLNGYQIDPEHQFEDYIEYENTGYR